jgi:hypothetical protein
MDPNVMSESSTPAGSPPKDTVVTEEVMRSEAFLREIEQGVADGYKEGDSGKVPSEDEGGESQESKDQDSGQEKKDDGNEDQQEEEAAASSEEGQEPAREKLEKRLRDSHSMIGRQSQEIGTLRKMYRELEQQVKSMKGTDNADASTPYYKRLAEASEDDVARLLINEAQSRNESLDMDMARRDARILRTAARMQLDISRDTLEPFQHTISQLESQRKMSAQETEWKKAHPDYKNRAQIMSQFIANTYPDGLEVKDDITGEITGYRADPFVVAHMAYEHAGHVLSSTGKKVEQNNNQRVMAGRSLDTSTAGAVPMQNMKSNKIKDPYELMKEQAWAEIEPTIVQSTR